jgi:hypothetical protein
MKKSIYKVTGWSIAIAGAVLFGASRNNSDSVISSAGQGYVSSNEENGSANSNVSVINYENSFANNESIGNENLNTVKEASSPSVNATPLKNEVANASTMEVLDNKSFADNNISTNQEVISENAIAKGGPNNSSEYNVIQQPNSVVNTSAINSNSNASTSNSTSNSARISGPTVVTAPTPPGGSSSGGSGSGDPFVPIDDYYGLIFLIATSTIVGIFTIKKSKIV